MGEALAFDGRSNQLVVNGGSLFPCGVSGVFSARVTFRLQSESRSVLLRMHRRRQGKPLLDLSFIYKAQTRVAKLRIRGTGVDSVHASQFEIDMHRDIELNRTHTLVLRIDRFSARARVDCGPWRIIGFPGLQAISPEAVSGINVRLGYGPSQNRRQHFFKVRPLIL